MKFSMIFEAQMAHPTPEHERQVLQDCVEQAVYAEEMGFDRVWAVEHHALRWYAHMSAPEIFLTWVAARTSKIRIGHGVVCMPFNYNHPVRAAERAAMLDNLSGGRLDLGAGRGATLQEMSLCGVDPDRTYEEVEEALRMIGGMWQGDDFEWHGDLLEVQAPPDRDRHVILPRPVQLPHPPLYLACTKRDTVTLAAEYGIGALVLGFAGIDEVTELVKIYKDAIASRTGDRFVSTVTNDHISALCPTIVLDDADEALRVVRAGSGSSPRRSPTGTAVVRSRARTPSSKTTCSPIERDKEALVARLHEAKIPVNPNTTATFNINHAYGTADRAIAYVEQLEEAGADEIMCLIQMGTVPQAACMETIRQWGENVIPHFRAKG